MRTTFIFGLFMILSFTNCNNDPSADEIHAADIAEIQQYLSDNGLSATETSSGLFYIIEEQGIGTVHPTSSDEVEVKYKGYFTNGDVFDETTGNDTIKGQLTNFIQGWVQGIPLFKKEGKGTIFIPSVLGYGSNPPPGIPENAVLIFDIELVDF